MKYSIVAIGLLFIAISGPVSGSDWAWTRTPTDVERSVLIACMVFTGVLLVVAGIVLFHRTSR